MVSREPAGTNRVPDRSPAVATALAAHGRARRVAAASDPGGDGTQRWQSNVQRPLTGFVFRPRSANEEVLSPLPSRWPAFVSLRRLGIFAMDVLVWYICSHCDREFTRVYLCLKHLQAVHGDNTRVYRTRIQYLGLSGAEDGYPDPCSDAGGIRTSRTTAEGIDHGGGDGSSRAGGGAGGCGGGLRELGRDGSALETTATDAGGGQRCANDAEAENGGPEGEADHEHTFGVISEVGYVPGPTQGV